MTENCEKKQSYMHSDVSTNAVPKTNHLKVGGL